MLKRASDRTEGALCLPPPIRSPRFRPGRFDPAHSTVHFKVDHMMISNVRGEFRTVRGDLKLNEADITQSEIDNRNRYLVHPYATSSATPTSGALASRK